MLARCGTVVFCAILLLPLLGARADAPESGRRVAGAAADQWRLASESTQLLRQGAGRPPAPSPADATLLLAAAPPSADPATPAVPPPADVAAPVARPSAEPAAHAPEPPRAAPAPRASPPPLPPPTVPPTRAPTPVPTAAPAGGGSLVLASWYGPGFYGNRTACGQTYTTQIQGVANLTLPCGTIVTLTYGGRTASVPVIDRGPYIAGRTLDLSNATRLALGCPDLCSLLMRVGN